MNGSPSSLPGCAGYSNRKLKKCQTCTYQKICLKVVPRDEVKQLLEQILNEIHAAKVM
jgi:hypothetical protein